MTSVVMYARWMVLLVCCRARSDSYYEKGTLIGPDSGHEASPENSTQSIDAAVSLAEAWPTAKSIRSARGRSKHSVPREVDLPAADWKENRLQTAELTQIIGGGADDGGADAKEKQRMRFFRTFFGSGLSGLIPGGKPTESFVVKAGDENTSRLPLPHQGDGSASRIPLPYDADGNSSRKPMGSEDDAPNHTHELPQPPASVRSSFAQLLAAASGRVPPTAAAGGAAAGGGLMAMLCCCCGKGKPEDEAAAALTADDPAEKKRLAELDQERLAIEAEKAALADLPSSATDEEHEPT